VAAKGKGRGPAGKGKGPTGKESGATARGRRGRKPIWLVVFAVLFAALFVVFAVAQGIGATSVPSGDAAIVKGVPAEEGSLTEAEVKRATMQQIVSAAASEEETTGKKGKSPKPGSKKYEELKEAALGELLDQIWLRGAGAELKIKVTPKEIEQELATIKKQNFPTAKAYKEFLEKSHFNQEDVNDRVEIQILSTQISEQVKGEAKPASNSEIKDYYEAEKATQFTTPASRDVRVIVNKDEKKVEAAQKLIEAGNQSEKAWKEAAKKYSSDPTTKEQGGLQKAITEEFVKGVLKKAIFDTATGELAGPVEYEKNFLLIEPVAIHSAKVKTLAEVKSEISQTLDTKKQEAALAAFIPEYQATWTARTTCASGFEIERCSNYPASAAIAKSREAHKACFEEEFELSKAEKKTLEAEGCQAPVLMNQPAIPGSVSPGKPEGERKVQRPRPEGLEETEAEGEGALPEAVSPESEAATGEEPAE
jgi:foldase protein PrsA